MYNYLYKSNGSIYTYIHYTRDHHRNVNIVHGIYMLYYQGKYQGEITGIYIKDAKNILSNKNTIFLIDGSFTKIGTVSFKTLI